jgi:hypothetical protein
MTFPAIHLTADQAMAGALGAGVLAVAGLVLLCAPRLFAGTGMGFRPSRRPPVGLRVAGAAAVLAGVGLGAAVLLAPALKPVKAAPRRACGAVTTVEAGAPGGRVSPGARPARSNSGSCEY